MADQIDGPLVGHDDPPETLTMKGGERLTEDSLRVYNEELVSQMVQQVGPLLWSQFVIFGI